ncbi:unnamed protein product [Schistocephalus solidus]|uniref:DUF5917 domain-containing protein n=1 Tax=Schistocephalus solidus TaxID=70667 RepID=A0A183SRK3_SCHSO|nr:unnamed protein product [Schistocephalus solidus]
MGVGITPVSPGITESPHIRQRPFTSAPSPPFTGRSSSFNGRIKKLESICDLLVPFVHRDGSFSWLSRDCLLLLAASSSANLSASYQIAKNSNLCEVLITDMVLQFNMLPKSLAVEDGPGQWSNLVACLKKSIQKGFPLSAFLDLFGFCCSIFDVSNCVIKETMLYCLHRGFLLPVLAPALLQTPGPETATATAYLECFLRHAAGSAILPFLLRFLLSDCNSEASPMTGGGFCPWSEDLFHQGTFNQVLERSFSNDGCVTNDPGGPSFERLRTSLSVHRSSTYMDVFMRRLHFCDTLTGVATLSLINTLLDFFCEDFTFELILKYLMPLGDQPAVRKLLSDPSSLMFSASQFLALIPPYLKSTADGEFALEEVTPISFFPVKIKVAAAHLNGSLLLPLPRNGYKVSQVDSVAGVDFIDGNWDLDEISFHGDAPDDPDSNSLLADLDRFSALLQRRPLPTSSNRAQTATSPSLTKAKLRTLYASRHSNAVVPAAASANRRRSSYYRSSRDVERLEEDIKRTSSLYDITYTDFDERDEEVVEDDARSFTTTVPKMHSVDTPHTHANHHSSDLNLECYLRPTGDCQPSVTVELDNLLDEAAGIALQHCLTEGQPEREDIMEEFMDVLDRLPTTLSENDASTEEILAQLQKTADELSASRCRHPARVKEEQGEGALKPTNPATLPPKPASSLAAGSRAGRAACPPCGGGGSGGGSDSGVVSLDRQSGRCRESASSPAACCSNFCLRSSRADSELVPLYPGPLLSVLLQLLSRLPLNHFFVNLLLTSVIAKLVSFPIPILRTLLLTMPTGHLVPPGPGSLPPSSDCCFSLARRDLTSEFPRSMPLQLHNFLFSVRQWMDCYVNLTLPKAVVSCPSASSSSVWRGKKFSSSSVADGPDGLLPHRFAQISASVRALLSDNGLLRNISVNGAPPAVSDTACGASHRPDHKINSRVSHLLANLVQNHLLSGLASRLCSSLRAELCVIVATSVTCRLQEVEVDPSSDTCQCLHPDPIAILKTREQQPPPDNARGVALNLGWVPRAFRVKHIAANMLFRTGRSRLTSLLMNRKGASIDKSNSPLQPPTTSASDWCTPTCPDLDAVFAGAFHDQPVCGGFDSERSRHIILSCLIFEDFCMELSAICLEQSTFVLNVDG